MVPLTSEGKNMYVARPWMVVTRDWVKDFESKDEALDWAAYYGGALMAYGEGPQGQTAWAYTLIGKTEVLIS